ncbi:uncharacterized protein TNCV_202211 [Trichonephila clavipes]|nr:uncharacterized protein TNCV_202211 [Trichonephila clavipes]
MEMHDIFSKLDMLKIYFKRGNEKKLVKNDNNTNACQNIVTTDINNLKLPRIELPAFTSNYMDWISFRDLFLASVGDNSTLSDSQKLQYLKLSVKGEAPTLLQSIQITNDNSKKGWNALTERYENEAEIINAALNKLVSQPVLKQESASGLRKLIDTTQQCIDTANLKAARGILRHPHNFLAKGETRLRNITRLDSRTNKLKKISLSPSLNRSF